MRFCIHCGSELPDGVKFCVHCGKPVESVEEPEQKTIDEDFFDEQHEEVEASNIVWAEESDNSADTLWAEELENDENEPKKHGTIRKCPNCGEVIEAFVGECPSCGYEFRETGVATSVEKFTAKLSQADTDEQRAVIIRSFPIPNTKEDILEFMLLASSNIEGDQDSEVFDAWQVKFEQSYQKAKLVIKDEDFAKVKEIYDNTDKQIKVESRKHNIKAIGKATGKAASGAKYLAGINILFAAGIILCLIGLFMGYDGEMIMLAGGIVLIIASISLARVNTSNAEYAVGIGCGIILLIIGSINWRADLLQLFGIIVLIIVGINYARRTIKRTKSDNERRL